MKNKRIALLCAAFTAGVTVSACGNSVNTEELPEPEWTGEYNYEDDIVTYTAYDTLEASYRGTNSTGMLIENEAAVEAAKVEVSKKSSNSSIRTLNDLYGLGSAILVKNGSFTAEGSGGKIETDASGAAAIYVYESGSVSVTDTEIDTVGIYSPALQLRTAEGNPDAYLEHALIYTSGRVSPGIKTVGDVGVNVKDSYIQTSAKSSPAIIASGNLQADSTTAVAKGSEVLQVEGESVAWLEEMTLSARQKGSNPEGFNYGILLYSEDEKADPEVQSTELDLVKSDYTNERGNAFYVTNTEAWLNIDSTSITSVDGIGARSLASDTDDTEGTEDTEASGETAKETTSDTDTDSGDEADAGTDACFIRVSGNDSGWGETGSNGGSLKVNYSEIDVNGNVVVDAISTLELYIYNGSIWTGTILTDNSLSGGVDGDGDVTVSLSAGSTWTVTNDCTLDRFCGAGELVDADGRTVSLVGTDGTVYISGDSPITVTTGSYDVNDLF